MTKVDPSGHNPKQPPLQMDPAGGAGDPVAPADAPAAGPSPEELQAALVESQRREAEANARAEAERARIDTLIQQAPSQQPEPIAAPEPMSTMPDPATDPADFAKWMERREASRDAAIRREMEQNTAEQSQAAAARDLWSSFKAQYPDYSGLPDLARVAFDRVIPSFGNRIPTDPAATDALLLTIKNSIDAMRGGPPAPPSAPANRTGGLSAGSPAARPPAPPAPQDEPVSTLSDSILKAQMDAGLI